MSVAAEVWVLEPSLDVMPTTGVASIAGQTQDALLDEIRQNGCTHVGRNPE